MKVLKHLFHLLTTILLLSSNTVIAGEEIPLDSQVIRGVLPNGLTYYIRHNEEPKERASFYIIQNVGALLENDEQNGLAHFLEHMAFNGTENFPGKGIINTLQRNGVEFGRNLNAYTSYDETVYNISEVPTKDEALLDTCLLVLHDWCNYLLLTDEEIDNERGVITEEWRTRRTARRRMWNERLELMMKGSKYTERDVIGSLDVIQNHDYDTLRAFYHNWYRTDLQAIAIVGDFDTELMEQKVIDRFSHIPAIENPKERYYIDIPRHKEPIFGVITDKEATNTSIDVTFKHEQTPIDKKNKNYYRLQIMRSLYQSMFGERINEIMQKENPPFLGAYSAYVEYVKDLDLYYIGANAQTNKEAPALAGVLIENERVKRHGFTEGELERAKLNQLSSLESAYKQRDKISNDSYCREYSRHYLEGEICPGIGQELELNQEMLPNISVEDLNQLAKEWISYENMVVIVSGPEGDTIQHLSQEEAFAIIDSVKQLEITPYIDKAGGEELISQALKGSKITTTKQLEVLNAEEWTLENGIRVVYRFSDIQKDRLHLSAKSKGGTSLYSLEDLPSAQMADMIDQFGLADFDPSTLQKMLAGKNVSVSASISELTENVSGSASIDDVEELFQLMYLTFTAPRIDKAIFNTKQQQIYTYIQNSKNDPKRAISDSSTLITTDHHPRSLLFNEDFIKQVSLDKMEKIYKERFADGDDFIFFITGNLSKKEVAPLVETYIGSLSTTEGKENWIDHEILMPKEKVSKSIDVKMETPKSTAKIYYANAPLPYTPENILYARLLGDILDIRYVETVREEEGGTYGVGVSCYMNQHPKSSAILSISFDCDPGKAKDLVPIIYRELNKIAEKGALQDDLNKVIATSKKNREQAFEQNNFWLSAMQAHYFSELDIVSPSYFEDIIDTITPQDIQRFTQQLLEQSKQVELIFYPEEKEVELGDATNHQD